MPSTSCFRVTKQWRFEKHNSKFRIMDAIFFFSFFLFQLRKLASVHSPLPQHNCFPASHIWLPPLSFASQAISSLSTNLLPRQLHSTWETSVPHTTLLSGCYLIKVTENLRSWLVAAMTVFYTTVTEYWRILFLHCRLFLKHGRNHKIWFSQKDEFITP